MKYIPILLILMAGCATDRYTYKGDDMQGFMQEIAQREQYYKISVECIGEKEYEVICK